MKFSQVNDMRIPSGTAIRIRHSEKVLWNASKPVVLEAEKITSDTYAAKTIYTGGIISINTNLDRIKQICRKPMKKVPKGLLEYSITTEDVEKMFLDFCEQDEA